MLNLFTFLYLIPRGGRQKISIFQGGSPLSSDPLSVYLGDKKIKIKLLFSPFFINILLEPLLWLGVTIQKNCLIKKAKGTYFSRRGVDPPPSHIFSFSINLKFCEASSIRRFYNPLFSFFVKLGLLVVNCHLNQASKEFKNP